MSLQVITVESVSDCQVVGVYLNEKLAKKGVNDYVERGDVPYKRKLAKKEAETKRLLFVEHSKDKDAERRSIYATSVPFDLPVSGKAKKTKDPNAPRRGMTAFMLFSNDNRAKIKESKPDATFGEIGRLVGEAWKALTDKQREVYTKRAEADKQRYTSEMETYQPTEQPNPTPVAVKVEAPAPVEAAPVATPAPTKVAKPKVPKVAKVAKV